MKLFVFDRNSQNKIYINLLASTRIQLADLLGSPIFTINNKQYHVNDVFAESDINNVLVGSVTGSVVGILGGPYGVAAGAVIGGYLGSKIDKTENEKITFFNNSTYEFQ